MTPWIEDALRRTHAHRATVFAAGLAEVEQVIGGQPETTFVTRDGNTLKALILHDGLPTLLPLNRILT